MLDLLVVCQRITPYYSVFVTCLKLNSNVLSVYQRTCRIFHMSAYVGAIRRSETGPLCEGYPYYENKLKHVVKTFQHLKLIRSHI